ncbi:hypothetical protein [Cellulomonas terrae]|nr:hypothetical protein [Cellulomonas terrae]
MELRDAGASASVHHVTLLSPVITVGGHAGPAAADGLGSFALFGAARAR